MFVKLIVFAFFFSVCQCSVQGQLVTNNSSFTAGTVVESFEGIASNGGNMRVATPFALPTGIQIVEPSPTRGDSSALFIVNGGFFGLGAASQIIPDGTAYLGQANAGLFDEGVVLVLPELSHRVGGFVASATAFVPDALVNIEFMNDSGDVIGSTSTRNVVGTVGNGWRQNFIGWESAEGIRSVRYDGFGNGVLRVDAFQFQPLTATVPEPGSGMVLVSGLAMVAFRRSRSVAS